MESCKNEPVSIILSIGLILCLLFSLGQSVYLSISKEKIEVQATNSNQNDMIE